MLEVSVIRIRLLQKKDIPACIAIVQQNYDRVYARCAASELRHMFERNIINLKYIVAEEKGVIVGFVGFSQTAIDYHVSGIFWVNVAPKTQREGVGKKMVARTIALMRKSTPHTDLILLTARPEVQGYYREFGFKILCRFGKKNYALMGLKLT